MGTVVLHVRRVLHAVARKFNLTNPTNSTPSLWFLPNELQLRCLW